MDHGTMADVSSNCIVPNIHLCIIFSGLLSCSALLYQSMELVKFFFSISVGYAFCALPHMGYIAAEKRATEEKKKRTIILYHEIIRTFWSTWSVWCERARVLTECENIYSTIESNCVRCSADAVRALFIVRILLMLVNCCLKTKHFWFDFCVVPKHHIMKLNVALKYFKLDRFFFSFFLFADAAVLELRNNEFDF